MDAKDIEILLLREKCQVLTNLIRDAVENETASNELTPMMGAAYLDRVLTDQFMRRREVVAEMSTFLHAEDSAVITVIS